MFDRRRYQAYYWQTGERAFFRYIVVTPAIGNVREYVIKLFVENGAVAAQADGSLKHGIPFATNVINYSKSEMQDFLYLALFLDRGCWDFDSISILEIDPNKLLDQTYQKVLQSIGRAQNFRFKISDFLGRNE